VDVTPGTAMYQSAGATSMKTPFAISATPSNTAIPRFADFNMTVPFIEGDEDGMHDPVKPLPA
jgi:hypothetical protein